MSHVSIVGLLLQQAKVRLHKSALICIIPGCSLFVTPYEVHTTTAFQVVRKCVKTSKSSVSPQNGDRPKFIKKEVMAVIKKKVCSFNFTWNNHKCCRKAALMWYVLPIPRPTKSLLSLRPHPPTCGLKSMSGSYQVCPPPSLPKSLTHYFTKICFSQTLPHSLPR